MHSCQECQEIYSAWLDGEAAPAEVEQMQSHVAGCSECRQWTTGLQDLSQELRQDSSDYLRLATGSLAELVMLEPAQVRLLPTPGQFLMSKLVPTLAVGAWSALLLVVPGLFRFWPLLAMLLFSLTLKRSSRAVPVSLQNGWQQALRPLGWSLLSLVLLPTSALCYREGSQQMADGVIGGLGICLAAGAGALLGVVHVANPKAWTGLRTGCWLLSAILLGSSWSEHEWVTALLLAASSGVILLGIRRALGETNLAGESLPFHYPGGLILLDLCGFVLAVLTARLPLRELASYDFIKFFGLNDVNYLGTLIPLGWALWWVMLRNPLACGYELSLGTSTRYKLASAFGLAVLAAPVAWQAWGEHGARPTVVAALGGLIAGLLLSHPGRNPVSTQRRGILRQRLALWVLALTAFWVSQRLWQLRLPGEPEQARTLREAAAQRPPAQGENGYDWVNFELRHGLDASLPDPQIASEPRLRRRLLGYLEANFKHIDHCLSCPSFRSPQERLAREPGARQISQALWLRAEADLERGDLELAVTHLLGVARWEEWMQCNGRSRDWWLPNQDFCRRLRDDLSGVALNANQVGRLWEGLHCSDDLTPNLRHQQDLNYLDRCLRVTYQLESPHLLAMPQAYYDRELAQEGQAFLDSREPGSRRSWPDQELAYFNLCRASLAVTRFLAERDRLPIDLDEAGAAFPDIKYMREGNRARLRVEQQIEWEIWGGRHE